MVIDEIAMECTQLWASVYSFNTRPVANGVWFLVSELLSKVFAQIAFTETLIIDRMSDGPILSVIHWHIAKH